MARSFIAVALFVFAGCNFRVEALPLDIPDLGVGSDLGGGGVGGIGGGGGGGGIAGGGGVGGGGGGGSVGVDMAGAIDMADGVDLATPTGALMPTRDAIPAGNIDLTAEGMIDWAQYGDGTPSTVNHKSGITPRIKLASNAPLGQFGAYMPKFKWTNGTPMPMANNVQTGVFVNGVGSSITISTPADTTTRTLRLYLTNFDSTASITAHLSDGSAPDYGEMLTASGGNTYYRVTIAFRAASPGQTLTVTWQLQVDGGNGSGSVDALAATLY